MSDITRVLVLAGGLSYEREVSLRSGRRVADALVAVGVEAVIQDADAALIGTLRSAPPDAVFIALHGETGEDGAIREVLELLAVPYAGSSPAVCRVAYDKPLAKAAVAATGATTPDSVSLPQATFRELGASALLDRVAARLGLPLIVKPARGGSALGATIVRDIEQLPTAMVACFSYGETALIEQFVAGTEVAVSVVDTGSGPVALPPVEIVADEGVFDYAARYTPGRTEYFVPARLEADVARAAQDLAVRAHQTLGLRDLSRTDLIIGSAGPVFLEVNVSPGMTETSLLPMAVSAAGMDLGTVCRDLLQQAANRGG